jgi:hypothetical protein
MGQEILKNASTTGPLVNAAANENVSPSIAGKVNRGAVAPLVRAGMHSSKGSEIVKLMKL